MTETCFNLSFAAFLVAAVPAFIAGFLAGLAATEKG